MIFLLWLLAMYPYLEIFGRCAKGGEGDTLCNGPQAGGGGVQYVMKNIQQAFFYLVSKYILFSLKMYTFFLKCIFFPSKCILFSQNVY